MVKLFLARESLVSDIPAGDGWKSITFFTVYCNDTPISHWILSHAFKPDEQSSPLHPILSGGGGGRGQLGGWGGKMQSLWSYFQIFFFPHYEAMTSDFRQDISNVFQINYTVQKASEIEVLSFEILCS